MHNTFIGAVYLPWTFSNAALNDISSLENSGDVIIFGKKVKVRILFLAI